MASWTIYDKSGNPRHWYHAEVDADGNIVRQDTLELHDEWMGECFLTVSIKNAEPIDFAVGDYIDYRGERYTIEYDPTVLKKARRGSYGEGFTYDNIKFVSEAQAKIVRCDFTDIVLYDNGQHYTSLPTFPFYCETVDDLLDRIQANLNELYTKEEGDFIIIGMDQDRNRQRAHERNNEEKAAEEYDKWIGGGSSDYGNKGVALTVDNINCWDALAKVHSDFGLNFIVRGYTIIVGTAGMFTQHNFTYGKGNGLYEVERICDSEQQIVTRLRAYGAETNLPLNYYANLYKKPILKGFRNKEKSEIAGRDWFYGIKTNILWDNVKGAFNQNADSAQCQVSYNGVTATAWVVTRTNGVDNGPQYLYLSFITDNDQDIAFYNALGDDSEKTMDILFGVKKEKWPSSLMESIGGYNYPAALVINRLMLPGFPDTDLHTWVASNRASLLTEGFEFSTNAERPYIDSPNTALYGIRPGSIYFDGNNDTTDIHPTITGSGYDEIVSATQVDDQGVFNDKDPDPITIVIPGMGDFKLDEAWKENESSIDITDGMCGGRSFQIVKVPKKVDGNWECQCKRAKDDTLHLWFPYCDFQINANGRSDHFVLTGIDLPDEYVRLASERLFDAAIEALRKNDAPRFTYQPRIDEIWMQRQDDLAKASQEDDNVSDIPSIHDTLKAGDIFRFADGDIMGVDENDQPIVNSIIIDVLTIKENGNNGIPTYEVTLRDEKQVSTIQKIQNKIDYLARGGNGYGGGGGGSSMTAAQIDSLVPSAGENYFISKQKDDSANGIITFLKGIKIGIQKLFGWDADGNITANNVTAKGDVEVNGLLSSLQAKINEIRSANNKGSGIFESGWFITSNHNGHSYLEIDELLVRMKAVFMELEIRKETYSGGNVFYSPAGSVIYRVECYKYDPLDPTKIIRLDAETVDVIRPFTAGGRFLALLSEKTGLFAHKETVTIQKEVNHSEVAFYRCYLIADDGTVQTRNWWHQYDQARCQTFNRASQKQETNTSDQQDPDFNDNYIQRNMDGNRFYWRLVTNTGSKKLEDGKWYDYVDLSNVTVGDGYVANSDFPIAGDAIVCIGNRSNYERMNMIMLEVIGEDAPAIKIYKGINSFSFTGKKYMSLSPNKIQFRAGSIEYITDNGQALPPKMYMGTFNRGQRYHYYEEVSYNGSTWLCIKSDGYCWVSADGTQVQDEVHPVFNMEILYTYGTDSSGNNLNDRYYNTKEENGVTFYLVRNFTVEEPSDSSVVWQKEVSAGGSGTRGAFKSRVFCRFNPTSQKSAPNTPTGGTYEHPWPGGETPHTETDGVVWSDGVPGGKAMLWSSVRTFPGSGEPSTGWSIPAPESDTATLDIEFSPSLTKPLPPATGNDDTPPTTPTGTKIIGDDTHGSRANGSNDEADWYDTNKDADNTHADWANSKWRAERKISNGAYDGEWVITKIKGEDGDGNFQATAFCRTYTDISNTHPTGGNYNRPWPDRMTVGQETITWEDGIPDGNETIWATNCIFNRDDTPQWSSPRRMVDTQDYDVEFAFVQDPDEQPDDPDDDNRHKPGGYYLGQIWFDPILDEDNLPDGKTWSDMVWRAERETDNGVSGPWVVTRIKGEKGDPGHIELDDDDIQRILDAITDMPAGYTILMEPQPIFVKQDQPAWVTFYYYNQSTETYTYYYYSDISVYDHNGVAVPIELTAASAYGRKESFEQNESPYALMQNCAAVVNGNTRRIALTGIPAKQGSEGDYVYAYDNGYIVFQLAIIKDPNDRTKDVVINQKIAWYLNQLGRRVTKAIGDMEQTFMTRREYELNDSTTNLLRGTKNPTIGWSQPNNDVWSNSDSSSLTIVTLSDSDTPIQGYNKAFRVATTTYSFYQLGTFWSSIATYHFSAYVRGVGGNRTAKIYMSQPTSGGGSFTKTFSVGTDWELVTFDVNVSNYSSSIGTGIFYIGINSSGTIEYVAPTLVEIANAGVVKTDYEGKIETSANGLSTEFSERCDTIEGDVRTNAHNISTLDLTAREIKAEVSRIEENTEIIMPASTWKSTTITDYDIDEYWGVITKDFVVIPGNLALAMTTTEDWVVKFSYYNSDKVAVGSSGYIEADQTTQYHDGQKYKPASVPSSAVYVKIIAFYPSWESDYGDTDVTHFINVSKPVLVDSKLASTGYVDVTADSVRIGITDDLSSTGIDITENTIHMSAQNTIIDSDVQVGSLSTLGEGCRVNIEGGVTEFFGMNGVCNIRLGLDDDGCAVLKFYNKDGVFMYDLGPNGIVHQLDSKDSTFVETAAIIHAVDRNQNEILLKYNQHANVTLLAQLTSGSTFYRFVEGYSSLTDNIRKYYISQATVPSPYNDKTYNSQSHSPEQTTWHPTGTLIAAGYYVGNAINISGILYSRDVFEVYSSGDIPSYMGVLYYNYNVSEAKAYLCDASGDNFGESTKYKIIDYLNGNDPRIGPRPRI